METRSLDAPSTAQHSRGRLGRIAAGCYDNRRRVVAAWLLLLVAITFGGGATGGDFKDKLLGGNTESEHARMAQAAEANGA